MEDIYRVISCGIKLSAATVIFILTGLNPVCASENVFKLDIPAISASDALDMLAEETGHSLFYPTDELTSVTVNTLKGSYTLPEALDILLRGTHLNAVVTGKGVIVISMTSNTQQNNSDEGRTMNTNAGKLNKTTTRRSFFAAVSAAFLSVFTPVMVTGQEAGNTAKSVLEEVIVTAQKREESLQDVPITIYAVMGHEMRANGIEKLESLAPTVPALHVSEAFGGDQIFLRGLGPGVNFGFEQAVGQVVDGYFYGRSRFSRLQFLDLERVEVLKGPQGAIIGKNTTAGAINITTARPTDEFEAWVSIGEEFDGAEGEAYEGAISGPLGDMMKARLALRYENKDGFLDNTTTGNEDQSRDDLAGRLSVLIEPWDNFNALFQYAFSDVEREGRNIQAIHCSPTMQAVIAANNIDEDCTINDTRSAGNTRNGVGGFEFQRTDAQTFGLTLNWEFDDFTVTSLTGYAEYDYHDTGNATDIALENLMIDIREDYEQFSQELRIVSNGDNRFDYIAGIFYQDTKLDSQFDLNITALGPNLFNLNRLITTEQEGETIAAFGQVNWHVNDNWEVTLEGRYTNETKDGRSIQFPATIYTTTQVPGPGAGGPAGVFNVHDVSADRSENKFSPGLVVTWHPNGEAMYYASIKKGFKGGGFDHQLSANQIDASDGRFDFEEEEVLSFELGGKLTLADGAARLFVSIFRNEYDDLQVSTLVGTATFSVGNAASAVTQGIEADLQWRPTKGLLLSASLAILDADYDKFINAPCSRFQIDNGLCATGTQDLSDKPLQYAPNYSYSISTEYAWPLSNNLELVGFVRVYGEDDKDLSLDLDPNTTQDSFNKVDARLTLAAMDGRWEVSLIGRNLSDKATLGFANDNSLFAGSYFGITESPRSLVLQGSLRY